MPHGLHNPEIWERRRNKPHPTTAKKRKEGSRDSAQQHEVAMAGYLERNAGSPEALSVRDALDAWMERYLLGWDAQTCIDRFQAVVAEPFDECGLEDVTRFEAALVAEGLSPEVRRHILERVENVLSLSRWKPTSLECQLCEGNGRIDVAQVRESSKRIYVCIECDQCWDTPEAVAANASRCLWGDRFADLKWWQLVPISER